MDRRSRRWFLRSSLALSVGAVPLLAGCGMPPWPGQAARMHRIGYLAAGPREGLRAAMADSLLEGLAELGYVEGQNLAIEYRFAAQAGGLPALAQELLDLHVELIVVSGTPAVFAAAAATQTVPIVMGAIAAPPVGTGLAQSLARPGGNVTGLSAISPQTAAKRLELLKETVSGLERVAVVWNSTNQGHVPILEDMKAASKSLQLQLLLFDVQTLDALGPAVQAARQQTQAMVVLEDPLTVNQPAVITGLAANHQLPASYSLRDFALAGGLMSFAANVLDEYRRSASYVDRILKGAKPGDLPIEQPVKFDLAINLTTAQALGLSIPQTVLLQATEVLQ